jgi:hypothetical protein
VKDLLHPTAAQFQARRIDAPSAFDVSLFSISVEPALIIRSQTAPEAQLLPDKGRQWADRFELGRSHVLTTEYIFSIRLFMLPGTKNLAISCSRRDREFRSGGGWRVMKKILGVQIVQAVQNVEEPRAKLTSVHGFEF